MFEALFYYVALTFEAAFGIFGIRMYEEPRYGVIEELAPQVEVRRYAPRLAAEAEMAEPGAAGRGQAFRLLFDYIAGANRGADQTGALIAMTSPVEVHDSERLAMTAPVQTIQADGKVRMRFFLPADIAAAPPVPADPRVRLVTVPEETIATLRFSGDGSDFAQRQSDLLAALQGTPWHPVGPPHALVYDAPFTIPFFRRNEAAVAVAAK
jgi:hypothetical protein